MESMHPSGPVDSAQLLAEATASAIAVSHARKGAAGAFSVHIRVPSSSTIAKQSCVSTPASYLSAKMLVASWQAFVFILFFPETK